MKHKVVACGIIATSTLGLIGCGQKEGDPQATKAPSSQVRIMQTGTVPITLVDFGPPQIGPTGEHVWKLGIFSRDASDVTVRLVPYGPIPSGAITLPSARTIFISAPKPDGTDYLTQLSYSPPSPTSPEVLHGTMEGIIPLTPVLKDNVATGFSFAVAEIKIKPVEAGSKPINCVIDAIVSQTAGSKSTTCTTSRHLTLMFKP
jgi:hypothetical protein